MPVIYTMEQYTALSEAISLGATEVTYGDKKVVYRDLNSMLRIQALMQAQLFPSQFNNTGRKYASFSKGTDNRGPYRGCR